MAGLSGILADTRPLQNPHFRRLWLANIVTVIGAQLTVVAVPAQIYADTGSSAYVGLTGVFGLVPLVIFGLWGGALADALDRRTILICTTIGLIATSALFWVQAAVGGLGVWVLLALFAVQQAFFAINQPTRSAVLPRLLEPELLPAANSLNMTVMQAGAIAGPLVGGVLIPILGFSWLYLIDFLSLFATLAAVVRLPALPIAAAASLGLRSVIDGLAYLRGQPVLMMSFVVDIIAMVFGMPRALFPQLADENFAGPSEGGLAFALLFAAIPAGAVLGGIFPAGYPGSADRGSRSSSASWCGVWRWCSSGWPRVRACSGSPSWVWSWAARPTWPRRPSGPRCCSPRPLTRCAVGCRASSSWWWPAGPGWPTSPTARRRRWWGRPRRPPVAASWW